MRNLPRFWVEGLPQWLRRATASRHNGSYELDVIDQWSVRTLGRFGDCTFHRLQAELFAIRGASAAQVTESLLKLEQLGLIARLAPTELMVQQARFVLTRAGRRLHRFVPETPLSPTIFYS